MGGRWQEAVVTRARGSRKWSKAEVEEATSAQFVELTEAQRRRDEARHRSFRVIPRFWTSCEETTRPRRSTQQQQHRRHEQPAATKKKKRPSLPRLLRKAAEGRCETWAPVLSWEELERLRLGLVSEERLNYEALCRLRRRMRDSGSAVSAAQLSARRFLDLPRDAQGRASARDLYHRIDRSTCAAKTRATLRRYVRHGDNVLREADMERYVSDLLPDMPHAMDEKFQPFYVFTAVRRFMFFLDPRRRGYVRVDDAAASAVALDLLEIFADDATTAPSSSSSSSTAAAPTKPDSRAASSLAAHAAEKSVAAPVGAAPPVVGTTVNKSWFFPDTAKRVYADYLELDRDHNGMLSKAEFLNFRGPRGETRLTSSFVDRVFAEIMTYPTENPPLSGHFEAEMDFKTYLDVVLAFENVDTAPALSYFWRLLDVHKNGRVDPFAISFFFRDVAIRLKEDGFDPPLIADVVDEIFDMVKPAEPRFLTFDDLARSKQAHTVILMLVDVQGFLAYDNREHLIQGLDDDDF